MNKIVESILNEFSKENGIEEMHEKDRFEYLCSYLTIRRHFSRALDLKEVVIVAVATPGLMASPLL